MPFPEAPPKREFRYQQQEPEHYEAPEGGVRSLTGGGVYVPVSAIMSSPALFVEQSESLDQALRLLENRRIRHLLVVDDQGRLRGMLSDRDLLGYSAEDLAGVPAEAAMMSPVLAVSPDAALFEAAEALLGEKFSCLPVVDMKEQPVGVLTVSDILRFVADRPGRQLWT